MKGGKLYVAILTPLALVLGTIMAIFGFAESWSQNHNSKYDPFLYATLFCISSAFIIASFHHTDKYRELTKLFGKSCRLEHFLRLVSMLFGGVIVFGVNSPIWIIETLHLVFTGLAIFVGYYMILVYPVTNKGKLWSIIGFVFGVLGFLAAFLFHTWSIAFGEVLASLPLTIWMYHTWILKK
jgi:hypothetical protein